MEMFSDICFRTLRDDNKDLKFGLTKSGFTTKQVGTQAWRTREMIPDECHDSCVAHHLVLVEGRCIIEISSSSPTGGEGYLTSIIPVELFGLGSAEDWEWFGSAFMLREAMAFVPALIGI